MDQYTFWSMKVAIMDILIVTRFVRYRKKAFLYIGETEKQ